MRFFFLYSRIFLNRGHGIARFSNEFGDWEYLGVYDVNLILNF